LTVDVKKIARKRKRYKNISQIRRLVDPEIFDHYLKIKQEAKTILSDELTRINGFTFWGVLTLKENVIKFHPVDEIWLIMKSLFEERTYTISRSGIIREDE
jgi:hypothetical protein